MKILRNIRDGGILAGYLTLLVAVVILGANLLSAALG